MKIFYWAPWIGNVGTIKAVINSSHILRHYSKNKISTKIIDAVGEWHNHKNFGNFINLTNNKIYNFLPKNGFIKSRFTYLIIFLYSFLPLLRLLKKEKPDYLVVQLITSLPIILNLLFNFNTKLILRISGFPKMNFLRIFLWRIASQKIYKVTCPTPGTYDYLKQLNILSDNKIHILYDPIINVKEALTKRKEKNVEYKNYFLAAGRLTKQKDFNFLCKATKDILKNNKDLKILIAGVGEEKSKLMKYVNNNNLQKNIIFLNYVDNIYPYFFYARAFILSSLWEDPGFVLIEAAFSRTLVLSNDSKPGPKDLIKDNYNGIVYKKKSIESFHEKFDQVLKNTNRKTLIYNNLKNVRKFTIFNHFKSFDSILSN